MKNQDHNMNMTNNNKDSETGLNSEPCPDMPDDGSLSKRLCRFNEPRLPAKCQDKYQEWRVEFLGFLEACVNAGAISYWHTLGIFEWHVFHEAKYSRICQEYGFSDTDFETITRYKY